MPLADIFQLVGKRPPIQFWYHPTVKITPIVVGEIATNCYLVQLDKDVLLIDPGAEPEKIIAMLQKEKVIPTAIIITHGHYDHLGGVSDILTAYPVPVYVPAADEELIFRQFNLRMAKVFPLEQAIKYTTKIDIPGVTVIPTPGHTLGLSCILIEDSLFSGDMLFAAGYLGRTDLWGSDPGAIKKSVKTLLLLPDQTKVYPGHDESTTIGQERHYHE